MALLLRLTGNQLLRHQSKTLCKFVRPVTLKPSQYVPPVQMGHDERNMKLGRPQSPHLTIYKPQLTAMLSISHRATGIVLAGYAVMFSLAAVWLECPIEYYIEQIRCAELGPACIFGIKFTLAFPLLYHFWNGIRHLLWDTGRFLTIKEVYLTGWTMLAVTIASAIVLSGY
ncbi:succinate dehydrogenase cytochrome b560 subunit, mitochondrial-like [Sitophilus oryzae]|uniref:Succinate dehydrogenase cytochrome b560 subunit, mitochondrial-like n=1 Tax=Sitophilus oryzae TaxID=7048 RepID=A0A6J2XR44_SITOR|nr:succinate dehydrogenase cytochrome b560 subunit, mitochondrial-like [Sitophilus oryzae]